MEMRPEKHSRHIPFDVVCENCAMTNVHTTSLRASENIKVERGHHGLGGLCGHIQTKKRKEEKNIYLNI
jgi:protein-arginine kinase activator protein McsA